MKKASEYRRHADECRALARNALNENEREQLLNMAQTWTKLADERERMAEQDKRLGGNGSSEEQRGAGARSAPCHATPHGGEGRPGTPASLK